MSETDSARKRGRPARGEPGVGRDTVIAAMRQLLKRTPPDKISRADLSREAGVDPGLVRYYFGNMSSLMSEVMLQLFEDLQSRRGAPAEDVSFKVRLRRRIWALIGVLEENPYLHKMLVDRVVFGSGPDVERLRRDYTHGSLSGLQTFLNEAQARGECRAVEADFLYMAIIGLSEFAVTSFPLFERLSGGAELDRWETLARYADFVTDLIVDGLTPRTG